MALRRDLPSLDLGAIRDLSLHQQWVGWKIVTDDKGKHRKTPVNPTSGFNAKPTDPNSWADFETSCDFALSTDVNGIGFCLTGIDGFTVIDLDGVRNDGTGNVEPWALDVIKAFQTYTELSPSGRGFHLWVRGIPPGRKCKAKGIEIYHSRRYMTVTGRWIGHLNELKGLIETDEIEERQDQLDQLYDETFNLVSLQGNIPERTEVEPIPRDPDGDPLPSAQRWSLEEAQFYVEKAFFDGTPGPPANKLHALWANEKRFDRMWKREDSRSKKTCGSDQSSWDIAVANYLLSTDTEFTWHELLGTLIEFRAQYTKEKLSRADYWARTIARASDRFSERQQKKQRQSENEKLEHDVERIEDQFERAKTKEEKRDVIDQLCKMIGCPEIIKVTRAKRRNRPIFSIHFGREDEDVLDGDISLLTSQAKFRNAVASNLLRLVKPMKPPQWEKVSRLLLTCVVDEDIDSDMKDAAQTVDWLQGYLTSQPRPLGFNRETYLSDGPWLKGGRIVIRLVSLETYLRRFHRVALDRLELGRRLRTIDVIPRRLSYRLSGMVTGMSAFVLPDDYNFYQIANAEPREDMVEIDDDEETEDEASPDASTPEGA